MIERLREPLRKQVRFQVSFFFIITPDTQRVIEMERKLAPLWPLFYRDNITTENVTFSDILAQDSRPYAIICNAWCKM